MTNNKAYKGMFLREVSTNFGSDKTPTGDIFKVIHAHKKGTFKMKLVQTDLIWKNWYPGKIVPGCSIHEIGRNLIDCTKEFVIKKQIDELLK